MTPHLFEAIKANFPITQHNSILEMSDSKAIAEESWDGIIETGYMKTFLSKHGISHSYTAGTVRIIFPDGSTVEGEQDGDSYRFM